MGEGVLLQGTHNCYRLEKVMHCISPSSTQNTTLDKSCHFLASIDPPPAVPFNRIGSRRHIYLKIIDSLRVLLLQPSLSLSAPFSFRVSFSLSLFLKALVFLPGSNEKLQQNYNGWFLALHICISVR